MLIKVTDQVLDVSEALAYVRDPSCGAVAMFEGTIRNHHNGETVMHLEYEVYEGLFRNVVTQMVAEARERWAFHEVSVLQRTGLLQIGDTGIIICISSAHRREALSALDYIIEEFKKRVPVWKKERTTSSETWVNWVPQL